MTRNISGSRNAKKARARLRQKERCSYSTWRPARARSVVIAQPSMRTRCSRTRRRDGAPRTWPGRVAWSSGFLREAQVDVFEGRAADAEAGQVVAALERP